MKSFVLALFSVSCLLVSAQTTKPVYRKTATSTVAKNPGVDSATILYNLGWDFYKLDSLGTARYYWDLASNAKGKSASKYAALYRLGLMQQNGEAVDTNLVAAMNYYKRAAGIPGQKGDPDAIKAIGGFYENGYGVEKNDKKALEWYLKAKLAGNNFVEDDIQRVKAKINKVN